MFQKDNFAEDYKNIKTKELLYLEFDECSFNKCDFSNAILKNSIFSGCIFSSCNLSLMSIIDCKFSDVTFIDCKIIGVDWTKANWDSLSIMPMKFKTSVIDSSSFYGLDLDSWIIEECEAKDVDFTNSNLSNISFKYTKLTDSIFANTNLTKANFTHSEQFNIDIQNNNLDGAKFSRYESIRLLSSLNIELVD